VGKTIPPLSYARLIHKGPSRALRLTLDYIHGTWLPKSGHSTAAQFVIEVYGEGYRGPDDPESESEVLIPIRKVEGGSPITSHSHKSQGHQE
jgi:AraC family transcriptional regulator